MLSQRKTLALAFAAALSATNAAQAQIGVYNRPQYNPRPTVSPYLSIIRGNPAINYFGSVRPQIEMSQQLYQLQQQVQQQGQPNLVLPLDPQQTQGPLAITTGHPVSFMNYSNYYSYGSRAGMGGIAGGTGNPTGAPNLNQAPIVPYTPVTP